MFRSMCTCLRSNHNNIFHIFQRKIWKSHGILRRLRYKKRANERNTPLNSAPHKTNKKTPLNEETSSNSATCSPAWQSRRAGRRAHEHGQGAPVNVRRRTHSPTPSGALSVHMNRLPCPSQPLLLKLYKILCLNTDKSSIYRINGYCKNSLIFNNSNR